MARLGGIKGAVAVIPGLLFVDRVGAGPFAAMTFSANLIMSVAIDQVGLVNMPVHTLGPLRAVGVALLIGGVALIARF